MTHAAPNAKHPVLLALALGVLGGAALIVTMTNTARGPAIFLPYAGLVLASLVAVRLARWPEFGRRFAAALLAFMVATLVLYVYINTYAEGVMTISAWGHAWRLGLMAAIGAPLSAAVAYLADLGQRDGRA